MALSKELQVGKAGEHLVCCDLILQGFNAFLADQGLPFDILVENNGKIGRIQVKATNGLKNFGRGTVNIYRFGTRKGKGGRTRINQGDVDYYAFVSLDSMTIAYVPIKEMLTRAGQIKQTVDFKTRKVKYAGRIYSNGKQRTPEWGKYLEDYSKFIFKHT